MKIDPFPEVRSGVELDEAPESRWDECVHCIDHKSLNDGTDPTLWAELHAEQRPGHVRFRTVVQANFSVAPSRLIATP
ncbi:hypothetical protein [Streptomyces sp. NBC_00078]|uniref:hypothetical protein n=1 Tax=unclassified Streptomyces TaxID=2593676 RepID=UPI00225C2126|nr:hypothetical protein [Streptomyces sp. NBC_00078]MCX5420348.1 hypothetical protein [Streptomyces sp. NBC_00078]